MTEIREIQIQSIAEPAQVKVNRGTKGEYGYEVNLHGEDLSNTCDKVLLIVDRLNLELRGEQHRPPQDVSK